jgi:lactate dehydrogenase-like 2-hydroxyacid dehydrogenase
MPRQDRLLSTEPVLDVFQSQPQAQSDHHPAPLKSDAEMTQHSAMTTHLSTEALADRIFRILERRLVVERERRGIRL